MREMTPAEKAYCKRVTLEMHAAAERVLADPEFKATLRRNHEHAHAKCPPKS